MVQIKFRDISFVPLYIALAPHFPEGFSVSADMPLCFLHRPGAVFMSKSCS